MSVCILPSSGIGDALLFLILAHALAEQNEDVVLVHPIISELENWIARPIRYAPTLSLDEIAQYDLILVENDNSPLCRSLKSMRKNQQLRDCRFLYPTYRREKHGPLEKNDIVFDHKIPMANNIHGAAEKIVEKTLPRENGLKAPNDLIFSRKKHQVILHVTSSSEEKNWPLSSYLHLSQLLKKKGLSPVWPLHRNEAHQLPESIIERAPITLYSSLDQLAALVYESGYLIGNDSLLGHLASHLNLPTLIIGDDRKRLQLWRPGWHEGRLITPMRWKMKQWKQVITPAMALRKFHCLRD